METIYLTGFSGTGKSMIAKLISSRKNVSCFDTDEFIENKLNKNIADIFDDDGEEYFRKIEYETLKNNISQGMIVALGGGTVLNFENRKQIKRTGKVIYFKANAQTIMKNLKKDYINRPLLKNNFTIEHIEKLINERANLYEEISTYTLNVDNESINSLFRKTLAIYNLYNKVRCHIYIK